VTTGIIDYGAGNLGSVHKAVETLGFPTRLVSRPEDLQGVDKLILPGVGAFGDCVRQIETKGLMEPLRQWIREDRPYFGICVGYQILFPTSEESPGAQGLAVFPGNVVRFPQGTLKVPHMGWNEISPADGSAPLWAGLPAHPHFYFVHSYFPRPDDAALISSTCDYGLSFASSIAQGNLVATQFHPEKSQKLGLRVLQNFLEQKAGKASRRIGHA
jgi:imidazole glycerol-phosphate synthase subunit HisH